jgi:hypothetical protein
MDKFEALGRYVDASERAGTHQMHRHNALGDLYRYVSDVVSGTVNCFAYNFDVAKAQDLLNRIADLNQKMTEAVDEANSFAEASGKPKLEIRNRS